MSDVPQSRERGHPTPITYLKVAFALVAITAVEVGIFYVESLHSIITPIFLVLSGVKFALVAMFYMHLRFDSRLFSGFFVGGLLLAAVVIVALMSLFQILLNEPTTAQAVLEGEEASVAAIETAVVPVEEAPPATASGEELFLAKGCIACHTIEGISKATIGPELTHIATIAASRKSDLSVEEYIRESIEDPPAFVVKDFLPVMPSTIRETMSDEEFKNIVYFLLTLK